FFAQRALIGSAMTIDAPSHGFITFERRSENYVDAARGLPRAPYIVAVASAENLDEPYQTLYLDLTRTAYLLTSRFGAMAGPEQEAALRAALAEREATLAVANARAETSEAAARAPAPPSGRATGQSGWATGRPPPSIIAAPWSGRPAWRRSGCNWAMR